MSLQDIILLHPNEPVSFDADVFQTVALDSSSANVFAMTDDIFENFVICLSAIETAWSSGEFRRLLVNVEKLIGMSESLGLSQSARVARQLADLVHGRDEVALAAVVARMIRVGEASLASALEYAYRRI